VSTKIKNKKKTRIPAVLLAFNNINFHKPWHSPGLCEQDWTRANGNKIFKTRIGVPNEIERIGVVYEFPCSKTTGNNEDIKRRCGCVGVGRKNLRSKAGTAMRSCKKAGRNISKRCLHEEKPSCVCNLQWLIVWHARSLRLKVRGDDRQSERVRSGQTVIRAIKFCAVEHRAPKTIYTEWYDV